MCVCVCVCLCFRQNQISPFFPVPNISKNPAPQSTCAVCSKFL